MKPLEKIKEVIASNDQGAFPLYSPAMTVTDQDEADIILKTLIDFVRTKRPTESWEQVDEIVRSNLGYIAGYESNETRERVERLFHCVHPVFGGIAHRKPPTIEEAFQLGADMIKNHKTGDTHYEPRFKQPRYIRPH